MNALLIFLKEPIAGNVKTRLAASIGDTEAVRRYRAMVAVLLEQLEGLQNTHVRFCYAPDDASDAIPFWILPQLRGDVIKRSHDFLFTPDKHAPSFTIDFSPQGPGNLGERLERASAKAFADGFQKVALIGSDCIHCGSRWINAAFLQTKPQHCAIGPSPDGGYYLLATHQHHPELFSNITWSSSSTRSETEQAAMNTGLTVVPLPPLTDIDDEASWDQAIESAIGGKLKAALKKEP
ncbi:TIGR04282 family arsenosugar biosynthesis glycosyltransferase [Rubritalea tangerina]|uniref:DUF2064 domain-containing protein n=1 Tax=Rubritalea tangerina TaxID=430798 RepID=A0ABW4ZBM2_9BACT